MRTIPQPIRRESSQRIIVEDRSEVRPASFADGTPGAGIPRTPSPIAVLAAQPGRVEMRPAVQMRAISPAAAPPVSPGATMLGVVPQSALNQAIARADGASRRQVRAPAASNDENLGKTTVFKPWGVYEQLGLTPKKQKAGGKAQKLVVSSYRALGFGVLSLIVVVLVGYIATTAFYFFSHSWIVPTVVSGSDDKVVELQTQLAAQQNARDKLIGDLDDAERAIAAEQAFQIEFAQAIKSDLAGRQAALAKVRQLASAAAATRHQIRSANNDYATQHADQMAKEYDAKMIDRNAMLAGKYQLAQISSSNLSLAERQVDFETRAADLQSAASSLDAILANKGSDVLSYDVLKIKRDYDASKLAVAKAVETRNTLKASVARQDTIIAGLEQSAYLRALKDKAVVANVPYENLGHIEKGTMLYGCKLGMVVCHEVGTVLEVLPGEVQFRHPHKDTQVRGKMLELKLTDSDAAENDVLFAGGKPMLL